MHFMKESLIISSILFLFIVQTLSSGDTNNYAAALHKNITLSWNFSRELDPKNNLIVHIQKSGASQPVDIIYFTQNKLEVLPAYGRKVLLLLNGFPSGVVALEIQNVSILDTGAYNCYALMPSYKDQKSCHLNVRAPWSPVRKSNVSMGGGMYSLRCETEGYPLAHVIWTDARGQNLTDQAILTTSNTSEQLIRINSQLNVSFSTSNSYTCTVTDNGVSQHATFFFPDQVTSSLLFLILISLGITVVVVVVLLVVVMIFKKCIQTAAPAEGSNRRPCWQCRCGGATVI